MASRRKRNKNSYLPHRILVELDKSTKSSVTLIEAPSGYGKTTAVMEYLDSSIKKETRNFWYTCFGESAQVAWNSICLMLEKVDYGTARKLSLLGLPNNDNLAYVMIDLQDINCKQETIFIIDNYQLIRKDMPLKFLEALTHHNNLFLHFIIISQPPSATEDIISNVPLMRYVDSRLFLFDKNDIQQLFFRNGISLTFEKSSEIQEITQGWVVALNMYCLEYSEKGSFTICEGINDLIENTIWNRMTEREQSFLLLLSMFESFTARQICVVLRIDKLSEYARNLIRSNIMIQYEDNIKGYVMHSLLRKYLLYRVESYCSAEEKNMMYERVGLACVVEKQYYQAAGFFYKAENYEQLMRLPLKGGNLTNYIGKDSDVFMMNVIENTPLEVLYKYPQLLLVFAFELFLLGKIDSFSRVCGIVSHILNSVDILESDIQNMLKGEFILLMSFTKFNNIYEMSKMHREAYKILRGPSKLIVANHSWTFGAPSILYLYWEKIGQLAEEMEIMNECIPYYNKLANGHGSGAGEAMSAEILFMQGDDISSEALCYQTIYTANIHNQDSIVLCAYLQLAKIAILRGNTEAYLQAVKEMHDTIDTANEQRIQYVGDLCLGFLSVLRGKIDDVKLWITDCRSISSSLYEVATSFAHIIHLKYLWLEGGANRRSEISGLAEAYLSLAEKFNFLLSKLYILIILGLLNQKIGMFGEAQKYIKCALDIAIPDKIYMPFAEMGKEIVPLIERVLLINEYHEGAKKILELLEKQEFGVSFINKQLYRDKYNLTPREHEISSLAAQGMNNADIAENLFISIYTVKNTLKKVFLKLNIKKRDELKSFRL